MKTIKLLLAFCILASCGNPKPETEETTQSPETASSQREFYQLKIYTFSSEEQEATVDNYLQNTFLPAVKRQGINMVGVFKSRTTKTDTVQKTYVLLPFENLEQFRALEENIMTDSTYANTPSEYVDANYDNPPYDGIQSILMRAFADMPQMKTPDLDGPRSERIYELRSYESPTEKYYWNKVDMFNAGGEIKLFDRLGFNAVFYGEVLSGPKMPNLMYMTTHTDMATRDKNWEAFVDSPEWKALIAMPKYENNVNHADIWLLYPTEYSDY